MKQKQISLLLMCNIITIIFLLILPYIIFGDKLYLGGDDTRLFYSYPIEFLKNITYFSWVNNSSIGINGPSQYIAPFLFLWSLIGMAIPNKMILNHLALSLPLILGLIYFQKTLNELFNLKKKNGIEIFLGSLFYIFSPILIINQMFVFLISIWLVGLIPIVLYLFLRYLRTSNFKYVYQASLWCLVFAFALYAIPWLFGFILPVMLGILCVAPLYRKTEILEFTRKLIIFAGFIIVSQAFWLTGFISTYLNLSQDSFASKFLSKGFIDTFTPTILSTATSSIFFPMLNLFHRQIPFDFGWKLKDVFVGFYDKSIILNILYVFILFIGVLNYRRYLSSSNRKVFLLLLTSFIFSIYFFTVNIGPLKDLFLLFKIIPGFIMFRNFFDKFAPGYVILYSSLITICIIVVVQKFTKLRNVILASFFIVVVVNLIPVKDTVNSPLWTTESTYKNIVIPDEYLKTMEYIKNNVASTNTILSVPFGSSAYTVIKDVNSNNVYVGVSPVKLFSGVNDISGHLSFNFTKEADIVDGLIANKKYEEVNRILYEHNINYVLQTHNIPEQVLRSWVFSKDMLDPQDNTFMNAVTSEKVYESPFGNYTLYKTKQKNSILRAKNLRYQKLSAVKYKLYVNNLTKEQALAFMDSYHAGWGLYLVKHPSLNFCINPVTSNSGSPTECSAGKEYFNLEDLRYLFTQPVFGKSHDVIYDYANVWKIEASEIKNTFGKNYFIENKDGSINIELILFFKPQLYFYIGILISMVVFISGFYYILLSKKNEKN